MSRRLGAQTVRTVALVLVLFTAAWGWKGGDFKARPDRKGSLTVSTRSLQGTAVPLHRNARTARSALGCAKIVIRVLIMSSTLTP